MLIDVQPSTDGILLFMKNPPATRDEVKEIVQTEIREAEKRLSDKLDTVMGELKDVREEFTLHLG